MSLRMPSSASAERLDHASGTRAARADSGVSSASSVMPMMPFIGVRISWLMFARNSLFAWFASSATRVAAASSAVRSRTFRSSIVGQRAQFGVEPFALRKRLLELLVRIRRAASACR